MTIGHEFHHGRSCNTSNLHSHLYGNYGIARLSNQLTGIDLLREGDDDVVLRGEFVDRSCAKVSAEGAKLAPTDVTNRTLKISFEAEFGVVFLQLSNVDEEKFQSWAIRDAFVWPSLESYFVEERDFFFFFERIKL